MPDAGGNIKGISLGGKAGETLDRIFGEKEPKRDMMDVFRDDDAMRAFGVERPKLVGRCIGCFSNDWPTCKGCGADLSAEPRPNG